MTRAEAERELDFLGTYARGEVFDRWLQICRDRHGAHGYALVLDLGLPTSEYGAGLIDNVDYAQRYLRAAEVYGVIKRGNFSPTRDQQFFDVNGSLRHTPEARPDAYFWIPSSGIP